MRQDGGVIAPAVNVSQSSAGAPDPEVTSAQAVAVGVELSETELNRAREAAVEEAENAALVGGYLSATQEDGVAVTARFARTDAAYTGWEWCVTLALVPGSTPTVSEVVLLPGNGSLVAPAWLPWDQRIRPGDLGPGDLLLPVVDDDRIAPAYLQSDDPAVEDVAHELGLGRPRVMTWLGRSDAATRWHEGEFGPDSAMAKAAPMNCVMCAFYLPLAGSLGSVAGVCGNEMSPADGRVVDLAFGCGAHSEIVVAIEPSNVGRVPVDETLMDVHPRIVGATVGAPAGETVVVVDSVEEAETAALLIDIGHPTGDLDAPGAVEDEAVAVADEVPGTDVDGADAVAVSDLADTDMADTDVAAGAGVSVPESGESADPADSV